MSDATPNTISLRHIVSAAPDAGLAGLFLLTWVAPTLFGPTMVRTLMLTMLMEFIVVHSACFMGLTAYSRATAAKKALTIAAFGLFYSIFVGGFSLAFATWSPLVGFWILAINRLLLALTTSSATGEAPQVVRAIWSWSVVAYVGGVFVTLLLPLPALGITPAVVAAQHIPGKGIWVTQPHRVIAFGLVYYAAMAAVGLSPALLARVRAPQAEAPQAPA